ncbi:hypothetical protein M2394_004620 [Pseudomonas sp. BIGb0164]|nr:hypothetical protein [Pseudomonas sp. BIGb0164]
MWELACLRLALTGDWSVETRNVIQVQHPIHPQLDTFKHTVNCQRDLSLDAIDLKGQVPRQSLYLRNILGGIGE